jgi:hypothetical protein
MMGQQTGDQSQLFYLFNLEERIPANHTVDRVRDQKDEALDFFSCRSVSSRLLAATVGERQHRSHD